MTNTKKPFSMEETSKRMRSRRDELHLSQQQLAEKARISSESLSRYERKNCRTPKIDILGDLADALQCETDYLLGRIEHPKRSTSEISALIPLSREAIESLEYLKNVKDSYYPIIATTLLNSLIVGIANAVKKSCAANEINHNGDTIPAPETVISDSMNLEMTYELIADYEATGSVFNEHPQMSSQAYGLRSFVIEGLSTKIGHSLSALVTEALKRSAAQKITGKEV